MPLHGTIIVYNPLNQKENNVMEDIIKQFCLNKEKGLFLIDMPTGFGKTYNVLEFIANNYNLPEFTDKKIFFITTLKKNLPESELKDKFQKKGKIDDFNNLFINLKSNTDFIIENLEKYYKEIPEIIRRLPETKLLRSNVILYNKYKETKGEDSFDCSQLLPIIREQNEPRFRDQIEAFLPNRASAAQKLKLIENDKNYTWIVKIYPSVFSKSKQIFFMSVDKFVSGNATIIEPTYTFYTNDIINNAIIFFDEFDSTKDRILNKIIESGIRNCIDYMELFTQIQQSLATRKLPASLLLPSKKQLQFLSENKRYLTPEKYLAKMKDIFSEAYEKYNMEYSFKSKSSLNDGTGRNFLFNDLQYHTVFASQNTFVEIEPDHEEMQNWLVFKKEAPSNKEEGILSLLSQIRGCISFFQNFCRNISYNYKNRIDEIIETEEDRISLDNAINTVLHEFRISREYLYYLKPIIMSNSIKSPTIKDTGKIDLNYFNKTIYENGFRYYDFEDSPDHNTQSGVLLFDFPSSPERILLKVCERAKVIGISATATLDTVVGNYDIEYLQKMLGNDFHIISEKEKRKLIEGFSKFTQHYDKIKINTAHISIDSENIEKELFDIFENQDLVARFSERLNTKFYADSNEYRKSKLLKVIKVLKNFIQDDNAKSFLCLTNSLTKEDAGTFDLNLILDMARVIILNTQKNYDYKKIIFALDSIEYEKNVERLKRRLSSGEKIFVMSAYNTVGAGQNLQYTIPNGVPTEKINQIPRKESEKDFDGIYLEKPTNLLVNIKKGLENKDLVRSIFQTEFLMERGEISLYTAEGYIKNAFKCYAEGKADSQYKTNLYSSPSVKNSGLRTLIQAVGRICRTSYKNKNINIYIDDDILAEYNFETIAGRMLNPEFKAIVDYCIKQGCNTDKIDEIAIYEHRAEIVSAQSMKKIDELKKFSGEVSIQAWQDLREMLLMRPTFSQQEMEERNKKKLKFIYLEAPSKIKSYTYEQQNDYKSDIKIKFDNSLNQIVSENDVQLENVINGIPGLKGYFKSKHYASSFTPNEYILTPPMFNNIYKGALGEAIGKYVFENLLNIKLYEMDDSFFEFFDFKTENNVMVDFKYWKETMLVDAQEEKAHIYTKMEECGATKVVVVNIASENEYRESLSGDKRILEIPYIYRLDKHQMDNKMLQKITEFIQC